MAKGKKTKHTPKATAAENAGVAFAQLKANGKLVLDEDGRRWAADVETAIGEAENETNALVDALEELVRRRKEACAQVGGNPDGSDGRYARARAALRLAGRLP